ACRRTLAGPILLEKITGKSVLVNCAEANGRIRTLDFYRFRTKKKKEEVITELKADGNTLGKNHLRLFKIRESQPLCRYARIFWQQ
ncbi:hypothetical protein BDF21DRAFT_330637, partial [Thamnidium elegans]